MQAERVFDFIVVGAGSAGSVVAARLSESGRFTVALVEAGGEDDSFWIHAPLGYGKLYDDPRYVWDYLTEPEPELNGARAYQPRGRVIGGTHSINGMVYMRGQREDYDGWAAAGCTGWRYDDVLPFFRRSETNDRGADAYRGGDGPMGVSSLDPAELPDAFIAAAEQAGYARNDDFNGISQEGFGYNQVTTRNRRRSSTAVAFLAPARRRANLEVLTRRLVTRVVFEDARATGIECDGPGGSERIAARREVILCAGAFNSPQLLQLSGIGPAEVLRAAGVQVRHDLPVGENLQNHFTVDTAYRCTRPVTLNDVVNNPLRRWLMGVEYVLFRTGMMATNANYCGGCVRTRPDLPSPDVQIRLRLWGRAVTGRAKQRMGMHPFSSFEVALNLLRPESRGHVRIREASPSSRPLIRYNYFVSEADRDTTIAGLGIIHRLMRQPAIAPYVAAELFPMPDVADEAAMLDYCRSRARSNNHAAGSCRMGIGEDAVVDPRLRVHGVEGLRVIDASIMPTITSGDINAAVIMIGERGADLVLADATHAV